MPTGLPVRFWPFKKGSWAFSRNFFHFRRNILLLDACRFNLLTYQLRTSSSSAERPLGCPVRPPSLPSASVRPRRYFGPHTKQGNRHFLRKWNPATPRIQPYCQFDLDAFVKGHITVSSIIGNASSQIFWPRAEKVLCPSITIFLTDLQMNPTRK